MADLPEPLAALITAGRTLFPDFGFFDPGGVLRVDRRLGPVDRLRIELPTREPLHLQSIGITTCDNADVVSLAHVEPSSWYGPYRDRFSAERLFDFDHPSGTVLHTIRGDEPPRVDMTFDRALDITSVALRNVDTYNTGRARGIRIHTAAPGADWQTVYDAESRQDELAALFADMHDLLPKEGDRATRLLAPVAAKALAGNYTAARIELDLLEALPDARLRAFRAIMSDHVLAARSMRWTIHGPQRCFEFWGEGEKAKYVRYAAEVADDLRRLTPNVCFGFGAALCVVRDGNLIPHDDDLDVLIGFDPDEAATIPEARTVIEDHLRACGHTVRGTYHAHRKVSKPGNSPVDVFVGLFEADVISWYPGKRGALTRDMMFPHSTGQLLDVLVPLPRSPLLYLEQIYGPGWRTPDLGFAHVWGGSDYADLVKPPDER